MLQLFSGKVYSMPEMYGRVDKNDPRVDISSMGWRCATMLMCKFDRRRSPGIFRGNSFRSANAMTIIHFCTYVNFIPFGVIKLILQFNLVGQSHHPTCYHNQLSNQEAIILEVAELASKPIPISDLVLVFVMAVSNTTQP